MGAPRAVGTNFSGLLETLEDNVSKVKNYCYDEKNFKVPIMKAVEQVLNSHLSSASV